MTGVAEQQGVVHGGDGRAPDGAGGRARRQLRRVGFWVRRYLPAEVVGTTALYLASWFAMVGGGGPIVIAYAATIGESIGFYAMLGARIHGEQRRMDPAMSPWLRLRRTVLLLAAECGPAELLDTVLARPMLLVAGMYLLPSGWDLLAGKIAADLVFYILSGVCFTLTVRLGLRARGAVAEVAEEVRDDG